MEFKNILYEVKDGILYLTLNRPEVRNALSPEMWKDIQTAVEAAGNDDSVQVIIISGAGDKALASGADIQEIHDRPTLKMLMGTSTIALKALEDLYKPVICAINGYALGGGCELAMACDIRIATGRSKFGQPETSLSIIPGAGGTQRLARLVGVGRAKELIYTADVIVAEEAYRIGLVNKVVEPEALMDECMAMAKKIASKAPLAVRYAKEAINRGVETDIDTGISIESDLFGLCFSTEDQKEGMQAFLGKRGAEFKKR
mgnify:CR=1 FL=1